MEYGKFDKLKFGKFKGEAICTIMINEPSYLEWATKNIPGFKLDAEMEFNLKDALAKNERAD